MDTGSRSGLSTLAVVILVVFSLALGVGIGLIVGLGVRDEPARADTEEWSPEATFDTWDELVEWAGDNYRFADQSERSFKLVFEYGDEQHLQAVIVSYFESMNHDWIDFAVLIAPLNEVGAEDALRKNFELADGSFALDREDIVMRKSMLLEHVDAHTFELALHTVASTADREQRAREEGD